MTGNGERTILNDRYEIQQRIGRGGMADVFVARDQLLDRNVAIKVLFPEFATDPNFVERFRREAQSAAGLNHPNIVGVYDWGKYANTYFMAMEYVEGRTLADILRANGHVNSVQAAEIASEVAAALGFAHRNGVVHRDIKPANILIGAGGQVKVADFGIARAMNAPTESNLTQVGAVMGTATYFSPEQAQGAQPDPRSDLYSLGIVLYEMVAGRPPFSGDNPVSIAYKQVHDSPQPLNQLVADVPKPFEAIVAKLLAKNPDVRYANAETLREDLRRYRAGEPVLALAAVAGATAAPRMAPVGSPNATTSMPRTSAMPTQGATTTMGRTTAMPAQYAQHPQQQQYGRDRSGLYAVLAFIALIALVAGGIVLFNVLSGGDEAPTTFELEDLVNLPLDEALQKLDDAGLAFKQTEETLESPVADGNVSRTDPIAGTIVSTGQVIEVFFKPLKTPVIVEDVRGLPLADATVILQGQGFQINPELVVENDPEIEEGSVIRTDPPAGAEMFQGDTITIVISGGPDQVGMPDVTGQSQAAATSLLQGEPFLFVVTVVEEENATIPAGEVLRTEPPANEIVDIGSPINLIVSSGSTTVKVPALEGLLEGQARTQLTNNSLGVDVVYVNIANGDPNDGRVISQSIASGTDVAPNTVVRLRVGRSVAPPTTSTTTTTTIPPTTTSTTTTTTTTVP